jgi:NTF2 fold immunity protein of polymorphic toxin system component
MKTWLILLFATLTTQAAPSDQFVPKNGFVPDPATAIKIAVAVWTPIYGAEHIAGEKPYRAKLKNGVWTVEGSLPKPPTGGFVTGGVAVARISQKDASIIQVTHGQ